MGKDGGAVSPELTAAVMKRRLSCFQPQPARMVILYRELHKVYDIFS